MYKLYQTGRSLAEVGRAFGITRQCVFKMFKKRGYELRNRPAPLPYVMFNGHKYTLRNTGYYGRTNGRRTLIHRDVWKFHHGKIPKGYDVHHLDRDRSNNAIENLELISHSEHSRKYAHGQNQYTCTADSGK